MASLFWRKRQSLHSQFAHAPLTYPTPDASASQNAGTETISTKTLLIQGRIDEFSKEDQFC
jgi:hypothetical protein